MPYYKVLRNIIAKTNLTNAEILRLCENQEGVHINKTYFSRILNNKVPPPSEEISRALAKVCGVDEKILVIEGYIDKAPKEIIQAFQNVKFMTYISAITFVEMYDKNVLEEFREFVNNEPMYQTIIEILEAVPSEIVADKGTLSLKDNKNNSTLELKQPVGVSVNDNALSPLIKQGSKVTLIVKNHYDNSDIVAFKVRNNEDIKIRFLSIVNSTYVFAPLHANKEYKTEIYNKKDVIILGKIQNIISDIS